MPDSSSIRSIRFQALKDRVVGHTRIAGTYLVEAIPLPGLKAGTERDRCLREFAGRFGFSPPDVQDAEWTNAEVLREDARQHLVSVIIGGAEIGHNRWDVPPASGEEIANEFLSLFDGDAQFYCDVNPHGHAQILAPYARRDFSEYIFGGGCVAVGEHLAAILWVLDND